MEENPFLDFTPKPGVMIDVPFDEFLGVRRCILPLLRSQAG